MSNSENAQDMLGQPYSDITSKLGDPATDTEFTLHIGVGEFRIELLNYYSQEDLQSDPPIVREATWRQTDEENLTFWFVQKDGSWTALHSMVWHPDAEF